MSRAVYLVCTDCLKPQSDGERFPDYSDSVNHGEELLRAMWKTRDLVHALVSSPLSGEAWEFRVCGPYGQYGDWFMFIAEHAKHAVELRDEYGGRAPVDGTGFCERQTGAR